MSKNNDHLNIQRLAKLYAEGVDDPLVVHRFKTVGNINPPKLLLEIHDVREKNDISDGTYKAYQAPTFSWRENHKVSNSSEVKASRAVGRRGIRIADALNLVEQLPGGTFFVDKSSANPYVDPFEGKPQLSAYSTSAPSHWNVSTEKITVSKKDQLSSTLPKCSDNDISIKKETTFQFKTYSPSNQQLPWDEEEDSNHIIDRKKFVTDIETSQQYLQDLRNLSVSTSQDMNTKDGFRIRSEIIPQEQPITQPDATSFRKTMQRSMKEEKHETSVIESLKQYHSQMRKYSNWLRHRQPPIRSHEKINTFTRTTTRGSSAAEARMSVSSINEALMAPSSKLSTKYTPSLTQLDSLAGHKSAQDTDSQQLTSATPTNCRYSYEDQLIDHMAVDTSPRRNPFLVDHSRRRGGDVSRHGAASLFYVPPVTHTKRTVANTSTDREKSQSFKKDRFLKTSSVEGGADRVAQLEAEAEMAYESSSFRSSQARKLTRGRPAALQSVTVSVGKSFARGGEEPRELVRPALAAVARREIISYDMRVVETGAVLKALQDVRHPTPGLGANIDLHRKFVETAVLSPTPFVLSRAQVIDVLVKAVPWIDPQVARRFVASFEPTRGPPQRCRNLLRYVRITATLLAANRPAMISLLGVIDNESVRDAEFAANIFLLRLLIDAYADCEGQWRMQEEHEAARREDELKLRFTRQHVNRKLELAKDKVSTILKSKKVALQDNSGARSMSSSVADNSQSGSLMAAGEGRPKKLGMKISDITELFSCCVCSFQDEARIEELSKGFLQALFEFSPSDSDVASSSRQLTSEGEEGQGGVREGTKSREECRPTVTPDVSLILKHANLRTSSYYSLPRIREDVFLQVLQRPQHRPLLREFSTQLHRFRELVGPYTTLGSTLYDTSTVNYSPSHTISEDFEGDGFVSERNNSRTPYYGTQRGDNISEY